MNRNVLLLFLVAFTVMACQNGPAPVGIQVNSEGFDSEPVKGTAVEHLVRKDAVGSVLQEGFSQNGIKEGTWVTYHSSNGVPKTLESFAGGMYNGIYLEFNDRGHIELRANYKNNQLDGMWATYKFGRPTETRQYKNGVMDGVHRKYNDRTGKLLEEINYKNGKYDGTYRFFNDEGDVTLEYIYKAGEKVSGGEIQK